MCTIDQTTLSTWQTLQLGTRESLAELIGAVRQANNLFDDRALRLLEKTEITGEPSRLDLVRVKPADLGFTDCTTVGKLYIAAQKQGLEVCPAEVGLQLALQHPVRQRHPIFVAMEPIEFGHDWYVWSVGEIWEGMVRRGLLSVADALPYLRTYNFENWLFCRR